MHKAYSSKMFILFILISLLTACIQYPHPGSGPRYFHHDMYESTKNNYAKLPQHKALAAVYDSNVGWSVGYVAGYTVINEQLIRDALSACQSDRKARGIMSECQLYFLDNQAMLSYNYSESTSGWPPKPLPLSPLPKETQVEKKEPEKKPPSSSNDIQILSTGTGFAINHNGLILTAFHIIEGASEIFVKFPEAEIIKAKVLKISKNNDLAVLKIDKNTPYYLELAESDKLTLGQHVFTIGFPVIEILGTEPKYTDGTISSLSGIKDEAAIIQISVPVQPGNSGGPLVNDDGKVVGIITSTAAVSHFFKTSGTLPQNVNWAVKSDFAKPLFKYPHPKKPIKVDMSSKIDYTRKAVCIIGVFKTR